jgi:hypothetical protein
MGPEELLIHYQPGARGDFLAAVLLDFFVERPNNALQSSFYKKIHHIELHNETNNWADIEKFNGVKIRIDANNNPESLIEIEVNHYIKNNVASVTNVNYYDITYKSVVYFLNNELPDINQRKNLYTCWIDFQNLKDINFLKKLYYELNNKEIQPILLEKITNNIKNQIDITQDIKLMNLVKLLDFEMKNNCWNKIKYFNMLDNLDNIDNYLDLNQYSKELENF